MARLNAIFASISPTMKVIAIKQFNKKIRELWLMSITILGAHRLFSLLQESFCHVESGQPQIQLTKAVHGFLDNFHWLANNVAS